MAKIGKKTKMPVAFLAFSEGKIVGHGSTSGMESFINHKKVQKMFLEYIQGPESSEEVSDDEDCEDFNMPIQWKNMNVHKKRTLITEILKWQTNGQFTWNNPILVPSWWPSDIPFRSPAAKFDRPSVHSLDVILSSFVHHQCVESFELMINESQMFIDSSRNLDYNAFVNKLKLIEESLQLHVNWLKDRDFKISVDFQQVSLSSRKFVIPSLQREPVDFEENALGRLSKVLSFCLFGVSVRWQVIKVLGLIGLVRNIDDFIKILIEGGCGYTAAQLKQLLGLSEELSIEESVKMSIVRCLEEDIVFAECYGLSCVLEMDVYVYDNNQTLKEIRHTEANPWERHCSILCYDDVISSLVCAKVSLTNQACGMNKFCRSFVNDAFTVFCNDCKLTYHTTCINGNDNCGCALTKYINYKFDWLLDVERVKRRILHFQPTIPRMLHNVLLSQGSNYRLTILLKEGKNSLELKSVNAFYETCISSEIKELFLRMLEEVVASDESIRNLIHRRFPADENSIISKLLYPEVVKNLVNQLNPELTDLVIERFTYQQATKLSV